MTSISIAVELYKLQGQNSKNAGQKKPIFNNNKNLCVAFCRKF